VKKLFNKFPEISGKIEFSAANFRKFPNSHCSLYDERSFLFYIIYVLWRQEAAAIFTRHFSWTKKTDEWICIRALSL